MAPTVPLPVTGPTLLLPAGGPTLPLAATGPTRRPRRRRVGRLLAAGALLAGLASTPHLVLAAVAGPGDPAIHQSAEHCSCGHERAEARDPDDEDEDERDEEKEMEDADQDRDAGESPGDGGCDGKVPPGAGQPHRTSAPPPPAPTRPSPPPAPAAPVLGS